VSSADDVERDSKIVGDEIGRIGAVRVNAADLGGCQEHGVGSIVAEPALNVGLARQVQLLSINNQGFTVFSYQSARDCGADHAKATGDKDTPSLKIKEFRCGHAAR